MSNPNIFTKFRLLTNRSFLITIPHCQREDVVRRARPCRIHLADLEIILSPDCPVPAQCPFSSQESGMSVHLANGRIVELLHQIAVTDCCKDRLRDGIARADADGRSRVSEDRLISVVLFKLAELPEPKCRRQF